MNRRKYIIIVGLLALLGGANAQTLSVGTIEGKVGEKAQVAVSLTGNTSATALQFNLSLPENVTVNESGCALSNAATNHTLSVNKMDNGDYLFVMYSMDFTALRNGTVLTIPVTIGSSAESGKGKLHTVRSSGEDLVSHQHESKSFTISVKEVEVPKCATPTISYSNDKLTFSCETEGAECHYSIADSDIQTNVGNEVALTKAYAITVYATKSGYDNSDIATATLTWIDVDPNNVITGAGTIQAKAIMIHSSGKTIYVSGAPQGTPISVYDTAGRMAGSAVASADKTTGISTTIGSGEIAIVKIGEKSVKVVIK